MSPIGQEQKFKPYSAIVSCSAFVAGGIQWFSGRYESSPAIGAGIILNGSFSATRLRAFDPKPPVDFLRSGRSNAGICEQLALGTNWRIQENFRMRFQNCNKVKLLCECISGFRVFSKIHRFVCFLDQTIRSGTIFRKNRDSDTGA